LNFRFHAFSEVRYALATPSNSKDHSFAVCAFPHTGVCCVGHVA
jgi:hypothetical protein